MVLFAGACDRKEEINVRIAVYVYSHGEELIFSETYKVSYRFRAAMFRSFDGAQIRPKAFGEAVAIQVGDNTLFASYLSTGTTPGAPLAGAHRSLFDAARKDEGFAAWIPVARTLTTETSVPRKDWPVFIGFKDPNDTTTAYRIEAGDIPFATIRRVTVQATSQTPDMGDVARMLPWIETIPGGSICPEEWDKRRHRPLDKIPCQHIPKSHLIEPYNAE
ncbi:hypothetical protein [uncultured Tateyamaria sp.]|uniref:hypothetical protein n=1 Tax=uncultured Tateyamaria sp. TaxID=455651 RepID=UPI002622ADCA|nr:hypothetical protein [uncultured Tateyamaria sp.]